MKSSPLWIQNSSVVSYAILLNGLVTQSVTTGHGNPSRTSLTPTTQLLSSTRNIHLRHDPSRGISTTVPSLNFTTLLSTTPLLFHGKAERSPLMIPGSTHTTSCHKSRRRHTRCLGDWNAHVCSPY